MIIKNGFVLCDDNKFRNTDITVNNKEIASIETAEIVSDYIDASDCYVLPGFIDTHVHGAFGARFSDPDPDIDAITRFEASKGVTTLAATTGSPTFEELLIQFDNIVAAINRGTVGSKIAGIHSEGPFLCKTFKGAMPEKNIITGSKEMLDIMLEHTGAHLKLITVAPEAENAEEIIRYSVKKDIKVSMGHTGATYEEAEKGVLWGATQATHTFNAMRPYNHREPGVLGCVLTNPKVKCEMICDFVHIHPKTAELIYRLKGEKNINIISDSGHSAGMDLKEFEVDGVKRYVIDGVVRLEDGTIAGSTMTVLEGVKHLYSIGIPLEHISLMASSNPAATLGIDDITGSISAGKLADIVILDKNLNVVHTIIEGKKI